MSLRIFSIEEGWRILFAESIEAGRRLEAVCGICVLVYDRDLPGVDWRDGLRALVTSKAPVLPIVMASAPSSGLRSEVLNCGGYDMAQNPLEPSSFVPLVNGALALAESIESLQG
jgi:DNA-binding response OmpR family regulator